MNYDITFFKGLRSTKPQKVVSLSDVLEGIRNGEWSKQVLPCLTDISLKEKLPCFTPTGLFNHRSIAGMEHYNGIICLDIDHVEDPSSLKKRASKLSYVYAVFITPSGKGLKVIIKTKATANEYKTKELEVADAFYHDTGASRDNRCKDISRIQYVSYDPEIYINENAKLF